LSFVFLFVLNKQIQAQESTTEETEKLKNLKQKDDELVKELEERGEILRILENTITEIGKEFVYKKQNEYFQSILFSID